MSRPTHESSGFILNGESMEPEVLHPGTWTSCHAHVGVTGFPTRTQQQDAEYGRAYTGPGGLSVTHALCWLNPVQYFTFARGQIILERLQPEFPELVGFFPGEFPGIVFFIAKPITRFTRKAICKAVTGVYHKDRVFFCSRTKTVRPGDLPQVKRALLSGTLPKQWEIVIGDRQIVLEELPPEYQPLAVQLCT